MELKCAVQTYNWGKSGMDSVVAILMKTADADFVVDKEQTYAELWMGTHENGPSYIKEMNIPLLKYIQENTEVLGTESLRMFGPNLPFLFKVLSIKKPLSIQVHPDKSTAKKLNEMYSHLYKDPNHKPEMVIAMSHFEALCGFRPIDEIKSYLQKIPELCALMGEDNVHSLLIESNDSMVSTHLRQCFTSLMTSPSLEVAQKLRCLITRLRESKESFTRIWMEYNLLLRLNEHFPGDPACFTIYLFNYVQLKSDEAMYIAPNVPHAYLKGDCLECMACSDNVIRGGFTTKPKDISTFIQVMSFESVSPLAIKIKPYEKTMDCKIFRPPVPEFLIVRFVIEANKPCILQSENSASIMLIMSGRAEISSKIYCRGSVLFIPANEKIEVKVSKKYIEHDATDEAEYNAENNIKDKSKITIDCLNPVSLFQVFANI